MRYRIVIDQSLCSGFGSCAELTPDVFEVGAGGVAAVPVGESDDPSVVEAAASCPKGAITLVEEKAA